MRLKNFGHQDPIGDMDLYSFDMIGVVNEVAQKIHHEEMLKQMQAQNRR